MTSELCGHSKGSILLPFLHFTFTSFDAAFRNKIKYIVRNKESTQIEISYLYLYCVYNIDVKTEYDDFIGREEQLRIAPYRRCAMNGKDGLMG